MAAAVLAFGLAPADDDDEEEYEFESAAAAGRPVDDKEGKPIPAKRHL
jgi:hypothetical protein